MYVLIFVPKELMKTILDVKIVIFHVNLVIKKEQILFIIVLLVKKDIILFIIMEMIA